MKRTPWRIAIVVVLMLSALGIAVPNTAEAQSGTATLTIHSRFCPENYDMSDVYNTCHDTVGDRGVQFTLMGPEVHGDIPGEDGNLTFNELVPGGYTISNSFPTELHTAHVYCSSNLVPGQKLELQSDGLGGYMVYFFLVNGEDLTCDWYTSPNADFGSTRASLTIHNRVCLADYTNFGNEWRDCPTDGVYQETYFFLDDPLPRSHGTADGNVTFSWLLPRGFVISTYFALPGSVYCSTFDSIGMPFFEQRVGPGDAIFLILDAGVDVICDWYYYANPEWWQG